MDSPDRDRCGFIERWRKPGFHLGGRGARAIERLEDLEHCEIFSHEGDRFAGIDGSIARFAIEGKGGRYWRAFSPNHLQTIALRGVVGEGPG